MRDGVREIENKTTTIAATALAMYITCTVYNIRSFESLRCVAKCQTVARYNTSKGHRNTIAIPCINRKKSRKHAKE